MTATEFIVNGLLEDLLPEKLALKGSYTGGAFQRLVAASYALAPLKDERAMPLYRLLADRIKRQHDFLSSKFTLKSSQEDPYPSMKALTRNINQQKAAGVRKPEVKAYSAPANHPALSNDENVLLRGVHDVMAHYFGQHPFSGRGEYGAYLRHLKTLPPKVAPILFTEIVGQTSYYKIYGNYTDQKAVFLSDFDYFNIGALAPESALNEFFVLQNKDLVPVDGFNWNNFEMNFTALAEELLSQPGFNPGTWL